MYLSQDAALIGQITEEPADLVRGRKAGFQDGYNEGYLRGRADILMNKLRPAFSLRQMHVMYVSSGKGYPYSPIDESITSTLRSLTTSVTEANFTMPLAQMARDLHPDLVLVLDGMSLDTEQIDEIRKIGIKTAVWLTDDPYYTDHTTKLATHYDYVFTLEKNCVEYYRNCGCPQVHYLPFGAYPDHYHPTRERSDIRRTISFVGSGYWNRVEFFRPIISELMNRGMHINGIWWERLTEALAYPGQVELGKWMPPEETARVYSGSKIVINLHRSHNDEDVNNNAAGITALSPNPRTFEISACGTLQLVDAREDIARFYTPGVEIETFTTPQEMLEKVIYYLQHEEHRRRIALSALERTLKEHTYAHRINELLNIVMG